MFVQVGSEPWIPHDPERPHILVAEDDSPMRALVAGALRRDGFAVIEARDGAELLARISEMEVDPRAPRIDLIISDIRMPATSGLEALESLRARERPIPIILMTGFGDARTHDEALRLGASCVFDKPFELDDLRTAARYFTGMARGR